jgi:hypothetical protein
MENGVSIKVAVVGFRRLVLNRGRFAIVDEEDYDRLARYKWYCIGSGGYLYAKRSEGNRMIKMHRDILAPPAGLYVDHKNHNTLDNRKSNLRICTPAQNCFNRIPSEKGTSRYKGVYWSSYRKRWAAKIVLNGKHIVIGCFDYELDAAIAYDDKAAELFGEFAALNCQYRPELAQWLKETRLFATR